MKMFNVSILCRQNIRLFHQKLQYELLWFGDLDPFQGRHITWIVQRSLVCILSGQLRSGVDCYQTDKNTSLRKLVRSDSALLTLTHLQGHIFI